MPDRRSYAFVDIVCDRRLLISRPAAKMEA